MLNKREIIDLILAYGNAFPKDSIGFLFDIPADFSICPEDMDEEVDGERIVYYFTPPENETFEKAIDRIERSKKESKNLFYIEWDKHSFFEEDGLLY